MRGSLFTRPEYLDALVDTGCLGPDGGWTPVILDPPGAGRLPCYEKTHSWGEFVFDFEFANAYARHGLAYYPKLVVCVPFTPVPGPRLMGADHAAQREAAQALKAAAVARGCSGAHVLFLPPEEQALLQGEGWLPRQQLRYLWHHRGYRDFDDFLDHLAGKRRKNIRRERRLVAESGFDIEWRAAAEIDEAEWPRLFALYANTYAMRGQPPYLTLACLRRWAAGFPQALQFCLARHGGELVAMAFFFEDGDALYGRHWGADAAYHSLHFELCYYRGIERCLVRGLRLFDAGVQGEHKLLRGFDVEFSYSAHWFEHAEFRAAIARFLDGERRLLQAQAAQLREHSGFVADAAGAAGAP